MNKEKIKQAVESFFQSLCCQADIKSIELEDRSYKVDIKTEEARLLIGQNGQTLNDIQYILHMLLRKQSQEEFYLDLDINDYKRKKEEYLKELANSAADEVTLNRKEKYLSPMNSYERRIIHLELSKRQDVRTESTGQGEERRIIVMPR